MADGAAAGLPVGLAREATSRTAKPDRRSGGQTLHEHKADLEAELIGLTSADRSALLELWRSRWATEPPLNLLAPKLRRLIAYRMQLEHFEGGDALERGSIQEGRLTAGPLVFRRIWKGEEHEVIQADDGFIYRAKTYRSLSAVARTITGTRWNGPVFFSATHLSAPRRRLNVRRA